jgi:hypothetical protein
MGRKNKRKVRYKVLKCLECGAEITIPRKKGRDRPAGHIKHMWRYRCLQKTPHEELGGI